MSSISVIIKRSYRDMNQNEKKIADYILLNQEKISRSSITDLSKDLNIADSTVYNFTRKLGFNGFKDFKISLLTESVDLKISVHEKINKKDTHRLIATKVFDSAMRSLKDTHLLLDEEVLYNTTNILLNCGKVYFFGLGGSNTIAQDAYHKFMRSPIDCVYISDYHMQIMHASLLTSEDCAFIISHTGLNSESIHIATIAKKSGCKIIVLTSYPLSVLARLADVILISTAEETNYRSESLSSRLSQLTILDTLFIIIMFNDEDKANESLSKIRYAISTTRKKDII